MHTPTNTKALILIVSLFAIATGDVYAKKMYRWVDENGNVYFSDQVPPDQVQHKRETLSEEAKVLGVVEKAKTGEEMIQQKRLEALRREQEKIIAKQAANDKVLLATYRNIDDMHKAWANKLAGLDVEKRMLEGNLKRFEQQLVQQQQQAAEHERNARKVPEKLLRDIVASRQQIETARQGLDHHVFERERIEKEFKADMARFQFLTQGGDDVKVSQQSLATSNANNELGLFVCQDSTQCEKAWKIAAEFVAKYSTTGPDVETEKLIMRAAPVMDSDLSLSVSKLIQASEQQIFLDIRCKQSTIGQELCVGEKVQAIRRGFASYIQLQLSSQQ